jgi:hypothetical protein
MKIMRKLFLLFFLSICAIVRPAGIGPETAFTQAAKTNSGVEGWNRKVSEGIAPINVRWYGALGDGTADDTEEIQAAINAAPLKSVLYFPRGTYVVSATLTLTNDVTLKGDGWASVLQRKTNWINQDLLYIEPATYVSHTIQDMQFQSIDPDDTGYLIHVKTLNNTKQYAYTKWENVNFSAYSDASVFIETTDTGSPTFNNDQVFKNVFQFNAFQSGVIMTNVGDSIEFKHNHFTYNQTPKTGSSNPGAIALWFKPVNGSVNLLFIGNNVVAPGMIKLWNTTMGDFCYNNFEMVPTCTAVPPVLIDCDDACSVMRFGPGNTFNYGKNGGTNAIQWASASGNLRVYQNLFSASDVAKVGVWLSAGSPSGNMFRDNQVTPFDLPVVGSSTSGGYSQANMDGTYEYLNRYTQLGKNGDSVFLQGPISVGANQSAGGMEFLAPRQTGSGYSSPMLFSGYKRNAGADSSSADGVYSRRMAIDGDYARMYGYWGDFENYNSHYYSGTLYSMYNLYDRVVAGVQQYDLSIYDLIPYNGTRAFLWNGDTTAAVGAAFQQTWNSAGTSFYPFKIEITDKASANTSYPFAISYTTNSVTTNPLIVDKFGNTISRGTITATNLVVTKTNNAPSSAVAPVRWMLITVEGAEYRVPLYQ